MRSTFFGLEIGRTGLMTAQFNLDVTSHNIANVNTAGYTRQRAIQTARDPFATIGRLMPAEEALVGHGTRVMVLDQIRSSYLDRRFRTENTQFAYFETRTQSLSYVRSFFNDENTSINQNIADFFRAMTTLSADPVAGAPRVGLQTSAKDLVQQLNMIHNGLLNLQDVENMAVEQKVNDINRIARQISDLNVAIYRHEMTGAPANDLRDKRNLLLDQLSSLVDIHYREVPDGSGVHMRSFMEVRIGSPYPDGVVLVEHDSLVGAADDELPLGVAFVLNDIEGGSPIAIPFWRDDVNDPTELMNTHEIRELNVLDPVQYAAYLAHLDALFGSLPTSFVGDPSSGVQRWRALGTDAAALDMSDLTGGELKAHIDVRDGVGNGANPAQRGIPYFIEQMDNLARALVQEINAIHTMGWTDNPERSRTGIHFFAVRGEDGVVRNVGGWQTRETPPDVLRQHPVTGEYLDPSNPDFDPDDPGTWPPTWDIVDLNAVDAITGIRLYEFYVPNLNQVTARNIALSQEVDTSSFNIAASSERIVRAGAPEQLQGGNNENIRAMSELFRSTTIVLHRGDPYNERHIGGFDEFATRIRFDVGNTMHSAEQMANTSRILTLSADNQRLAVAGVSLDEEMVGLVRFQHAFNGAARVITAMDDALDRIINGMGRVGL